MVFNSINYTVKLARAPHFQTHEYAFQKSVVKEKKRKFQYNKFCEKRKERNFQ